DGFLAPFLGERPIAPIVQQPVMQPILIDGRELVPQPLVEVVDDTGIAFHGALLFVSQTEPLRAEFQPVNVPCGRGRSNPGFCWSYAALGAGSGPKSPPWRASPGAAGYPAPSASSMMRRMVRAQRPHCGLQPRQS